MEEKDLDDVPPLEDMSEAFSNCLKLREQKKSNTSTSTRREVLEVPHEAEKLQSQRIEKLLEKDDAALAEANEVAKQKKHKDKNSNTSYCGFKKGFLTAQNKSTGNSLKKSDKDVPMVSKKKTTKEKNVFPEVQEAMKQQIPLLQSNNWVTEDLLSKILAHPKLSKQFTDPRFSDAIQQFQTDPQHVMRMCENNPELKEFIQSFCAIMGEHFTELGEKQDGGDKVDEASKSSSNESSSSSKNSTAQSVDDEKKMKQILSNPEVSAVLKCGEIQKLLLLLKEDPEKAQRMVKSADGALREKIEKLVDVGLLQMAV